MNQHSAPALDDACRQRHHESHVGIYRITDKDLASFEVEQILRTLHYPGATDRFGVTYSLLSVSHNHRLWVKCFVNDPDPEVPTMTGIWQGANWPEREVYDLFGVRFAGHPDLRRLMTWEGFASHPLRKDYPLQGRGERADYPVYDRTSA